MSSQTNIRSDRPSIPSLPGKVQNKPDKQSGGGLAPNGTYNLWQMLMAIFKYEKNNIDNSADLQKEYAQTLGGTDGFFSKLYAIGAAIGEQEAAGLKAQADAGFIGGSIGLGQVGLTGLDYGFKLRPTVNEANEGIKNLGSFEKEINDAQPGFKLADKGSPEFENLPQAEKDQIINVKNRINEWANGKELKYNPQDPIDVQAKEQLKNFEDKYNAVQKEISEQKKSFQNQIGNADTNWNTRTQILQTVSQGVQRFTDAGVGSLGQAKAATAKAEAQANSTITQQVVQSVDEQQKKMQQNLESALQDANQWAASFANAAAAQVHA